MRKNIQLKVGEFLEAEQSFIILHKIPYKNSFSHTTFHCEFILVVCVNPHETDMRQRSRTDIIGDILDAANDSGGIAKTKMMYKAFLSYTQLKEYLPFLIERGLLHYELNTQTFKTTQKGLRFLTTYYRIGETMKIPSIQQQQIMTKGER